MWFHSFVYGANKYIERRQLWHSLVLVKAVVASSPWLIEGDFNVVLCAKKKWDKEHLNSYGIDFKESLNNLEVADLNFSRCFFYLV
jgi:hypothetical protein